MIAGGAIRGNVERFEWMRPRQLILAEDVGTTWAALGGIFRSVSFTPGLLSDVMISRSRIK